MPTTVLNIRDGKIPVLNNLKEKKTGSFNNPKGHDKDIREHLFELVFLSLNKVNGLLAKVDTF